MRFEFESNFMKTITALEIYKIECGDYPETLEQLKKAECVTSSLKRHFDFKLVDCWGREMKYIYPVEMKANSPFLLHSSGWDGIYDNADDISSLISRDQWISAYKNESVDRRRCINNKSTFVDKIYDAFKNFF